MDNTSQLVKMARRNKSSKEDEAAHVKATAAAALSAHNASKAPSRILGYHTVHHGTASNANANNIREKGLKKSKGGMGVSANDDAHRTAGTSGHVARSKGNVYFTKNREQAYHYTKNGFGFGNGKGVITARISDDHYHNKSKSDSLTKKLRRDAGVHSLERTHKAAAAKSSKSISPSQIEGSSKYKGRKQFATAKNMKKYLGTGHGKIRFAAGVGNAAVSAASGVYAARKGVEALKNKVRNG